MWNLLRCITEDGDKNVCVVEKEKIEQIYKAYGHVMCLKPMAIYCIIHGICGKYLTSATCYSCKHRTIASSINFC